MSAADGAGVASRQGRPSGMGVRPRRGGGGGEMSMVPAAQPRSYYGRPILKGPVWIPDIAVYFFAGGLAGGSAVLCAAAQARGNEVLARRARLLALAGAAVSPPLLIHDLGRPERFHHMLRVFKVTSPMSVGSWVLSGFGGATAVATGCDLLGVMPRLRVTAEAGAALLGPALATYTAVLVADTAVPAWHSAYRELPFVFAGGALASAGAAAVIATPTAHAGPARRMCALGAAAEIAAVELMGRRGGLVAEPHHSGLSGRLSKLGRALVGAGAALVLAGRRRRAIGAAGGAAVLAGTMCERFAVYEAGKASAADPRYVVEPQRERRRDMAAHDTTNSV